MIESVQTFIDGFVTIEYNEDTRAWGYNPYNFLVTGQDDKVSAGALIGLPTSEANYGAVAKYLKEKPKYFFLAMDFPAGIIMRTDFVAIFSYIQNSDAFGCNAIPYDAKTGKRSQMLTMADAPVLIQMLSQFLTVVAIVNGKIK